MCLIVKASQGHPVDTTDDARGDVGSQQLSDSVVHFTEMCSNLGGLEGEKLRGLTVALGVWCMGSPRKSLKLQDFSPF